MSSSSMWWCWWICCLLDEETPRIQYCLHSIKIWSLKEYFETKVTSLSTLDLLGWSSSPSYTKSLLYFEFLKGENMDTTWLQIIVSLYGTSNTNYGRCNTDNRWDWMEGGTFIYTCFKYSGVFFYMNCKLWEILEFKLME